MNIEIYSKSNCGFCTKAKTLLKAKSIEFQEFIVKDVTNNHMDLNDNQTWISREKLMDEFPNARTVPQIKINGKSIGGFEGLVKYLENGN